ncbi:MAG: GNAT family N-acetyltransferase [Microbacteriaceae bacterium]|nr:GNAT family N-acetyltransferase [Cryobacterium sp.]MBX3104325.1 GNAT family N-acetyltransferase [Cryobacterium sp.]MCC6376738.1 GNAT family N-acetyltransferase [Microbacteriaceae bacterium]
MNELSPLSERVKAGPVRLPVSTDSITWRPATKADIDQILECCQAADRVEHPEYLTPREEFEEEFGHSFFDPSIDSLLAVDSTGEVIGFGMTIANPGQETLVQSILWGAVRPQSRGKGIGRQILAWQEARSKQIFSSNPKPLPGWIMLYPDDRAVETQKLALRAGFKVSRHFQSMVRDLAKPIPTGEFGEFEVKPFDNSLIEQTFHARNATFRDHWGSQPTTRERWDELFERDTFRGDLSRIALDSDGEVAGFVLSEVNEADFATQGYSSTYILLVGVRREYRRRGLAFSLLASAMEAAKAAGLEKAVLDVDSESPTGADGLYSRLGFEVEQRSMALVKEF